MCSYVMQFNYDMCLNVNWNEMNRDHSSENTMLTKYVQNLCSAYYSSTLNDWKLGLGRKGENLNIPRLFIVIELLSVKGVASV